ncbi:hypothetical protein [Pararhizobium sp. O133]|uniref:hypothetical protein n=1 Tax=Pararhizobium sp. O133 TaxID=3449278 RepID=UPI003F682B2C
MMHADGCSIGNGACLRASCNHDLPKRTGAVMECQVVEKYEIRSPSWFQRTWFSLRRGLAWTQPRYPRLDLEVMSDYMKRDMGFLDGRDPHQDTDLPG